jgi:hypothetical protein
MTMTKALLVAGVCCWGAGMACKSSPGVVVDAGGGDHAVGSGGQGGAAPPETESVLQRNKHANRDGHYRQPQLTKAAAATMTLEAAFKPTILGNVFAQPLYVEQGPGGQGIFIVVSESNNVYAVAETDGTTVWTRTLGMPAGDTGSGCGNITPYGITGTPVIDLPSRTLYVEASVGDTRTITQHQVHALSIDDGTERSGFPFDPATVSYGGLQFAPVVHNQRAALLLLDDILYVPYGGHSGDCGDYRGWVIGIPVGQGASGAKAFATGARGGGIWGVGGLASDGVSVFTATGNTFGTKTWAQGEAVIRLQPGPVYSNQPKDYFAPSNWLQMDDTDADLGGSGPLVVDVPGATPSALVVALGKNGVAYLLDRANLGGLGAGNGTTGEGVASAQVANGAIINAATSYTTGSGPFVVFLTQRNTIGVGCPAGQSGDLVALKLGATAPPTISVAWCAENLGGGSPIVTTTDGSADAVVWSVGFEASQRLHGFDGETGAVIYAGGGAADVMTHGGHRYQSPIVAHGRIIVAADNALYAFKAR